MRTILILITIYLSLRVFFKYILPTLFNITLNRVIEKSQQNKKPKPEGYVEIRHNGTSKYSNAEGEYVDYEEIK